MQSESRSNLVMKHREEDDNCERSRHHILKLNPEVLFES